MGREVPLLDVAICDLLPILKDWKEKLNWEEIERERPKRDLPAKKSLERNEEFEVFLRSTKEELSLIVEKQYQVEEEDGLDFPLYVSIEYFYPSGEIKLVIEDVLSDRLFIAYLDEEGNVLKKEEIIFHFGGFENVV